MAARKLSREAYSETQRLTLSASPPCPSAISYYVPAALLVLAAAILHLLIERSPVFPLDDAYITIHNAQVLHWGHDPNFVGTPALVGATSPIHLAIVSVLMFCLSPPWALETAALLGVLALALGISRLARSQGVPPGPALLLNIAALLAAHIPHQLMNGLETGWAMAGITWTFALVSEMKPSSSVAAGALCGTLPFLRPELAALSLMLLPLPALIHGRSAGNWRTASVLLGRCLAAALLAALPWLVWQLLSTGHVAPATIAAKRYWFAEADLPPEVKWHFTVGNLIAFVMGCGPLALGALFLPFTGIGRIGMAFTGIMLAAYYCQFPGALGHNQARYLTILAPILVFGAASAFRLLRRWPAPSRWASLYILVAAAQAVLLAPATWREHTGLQNVTKVELAGVARWCSDNLPPNSRLLIHDAGYISYGTHFQMTDVVGLKTPANVTLHRDWTYPTGGKARRMAVAAAARHAGSEYLVVLDLWDGIYSITDGLRRCGWTVDALRTKGAYRVYRIAAPVPRSGRTRFGSSRRYGLKAVAARLPTGRGMAVDPIRDRQAASMHAAFNAAGTGKSLSQ